MQAQIIPLPLAYYSRLRQARVMPDDAYSRMQTQFPQCKLIPAEIKTNQRLRFVLHSAYSAHLLDQPIVVDQEYSTELAQLVREGVISSTKPQRLTQSGVQTAEISYRRYKIEHGISEYLKEDRDYVSVVLGIIFAIFVVVLMIWFFA